VASGWYCWSIDVTTSFRIWIQNPAVVAVLANRAIVT
jgi:hypothetical protein